jgi:hypothetical protein
MNPTCPYCNSAIQPEAGEAMHACAECGTQHHAECWQENQGCTVYGCAAAPPDEPKITVQSSDLILSPAPPPPPGPLSSGAVPPPPPPSQYAFTLGGYVSARPSALAAPVPVRIGSKDRTVFVLLGVLLGAFGAHNFYAGYKGRASAQLAITLCTLFLGSVVSWIWALVEVCTIDRDSRNILMT